MNEWYIPIPAIYFPDWIHLVGVWFTTCGCRVVPVVWGLDHHALFPLSHFSLVLF